MELQVLINGLAAGAVIALVALGFGLIHAVSRFFHFAHGAVLTIGGYVTYYLLVEKHLPAVVGIPAAVMVSGGTGVFLYVAVYRRLLRSRASSLVLLLTSLGLYIILQNSISLLFGDQRLTLHSESLGQGINVWGLTVPMMQLMNIALSATACMFVAVLFSYTRVGKEIRAIASDTDLAKIVGVHVERAHVIAFVVGSALAGLAAILIAYDSGLTPTVGFKILLPAATGYIVGGVGSIKGAPIGGLVIGIIQHAAGWLLPTHWETSVVFVVLILILSVRPQGLFGQSTKKL